MKCSFAFFLVLLVSWMQPQNQKMDHSASCPKECKSCDQVVDKALKFIVQAQQPDGSWNPWEPWDRPKDKVESYKKEYKSDRKIFCTLPISCLNGLALAVSGSTTKEGTYQKELKKVEGVTEELVISCFKSRKKELEELGKTKTEPLVSEAPIALFFSCYLLIHLYQFAKSDELKRLLEQIRDHIVNIQCDDGGWTYNFPYKWGLACNTNEALLALFMMRHVGLDVDPGVFDKARKFYTNPRLQNENGAFNYSLHHRKEGRASRTLVALWTMNLLELEETETYKKAKGYVEKNMAELGTDNHGPAYHLFLGGIAAYCIEAKALWKEYNRCFRDTICKSQMKAGSIMLKGSGILVPRDGDPKYGMGICYTTPLYAIVLQLHKGHFIFDKLKPISSKKTE